LQNPNGLLGFIPNGECIAVSKANKIMSNTKLKGVVDLTNAKIDKSTSGYFIWRSAPNYNSPSYHYLHISDGKWHDRFGKNNFFPTEDAAKAFLASLTPTKDLGAMVERLDSIGDRVSAAIDKSNKLEGLEHKIIEWADERGIFDSPNPIAQHDKTMEEVLELRDAIVSYRLTDHQGVAPNHTITDIFDTQLTEIKDGIGDTIVTLTLLAKMHNLTLTECVQHAYDEIKDRKGKMVDGQFVKEV